MQDQAQVRRFFAPNPKNTPPLSPGLELLMEDLEILGLRLPGIHPGLEIVMEDLGSLGLRLPRIPPRIGTSHGRYRKLGSEVVNNNPSPGLEILMEV